MKNAFRFLLLTLCLSVVSCNTHDETDRYLLSPISAPEDVVKFFQENLPECADSESEVKLDINKEGECRVINTMDEFRSIAPSAATLPEIDFDRYTLIVGVLFKTSGYRYLEQGIDKDSDGYILNVIYKDHEPDGVYDTSMDHYGYWGLYPKLSVTDLIVDIKFE